MTYARVCAMCDRPFEAQRPHARYCSDRCREQGWIREEVEAAQAPAQRVEVQARDRSGARGGNIRDLDTARSLQSTSEEKARWTAIIDEQIRRVLAAKGKVHANDLDPLGVPAAHCNLIGARIAWHGNKGFTVATTERRKVTHRAANGRKTFVHQITERGRKWLVGFSSGIPESEPGATCVAVSAAAESGALQPPAVPSRPAGGAAPPEPDSLPGMEPPAVRPRSAIDDDLEAA